MVDITRNARSPSPVKMLLMLAPPGLSRPSPLRDAALDDGGVLGVVGHQQLAGLLLPPAEVGDAVVVAVQDARLAGRRRGGQQRVPVAQLVRARSGSSWTSSGTRPARSECDRTSWDRPSSWMTTRPGASVLDDVRATARQRPDEGAVVRLVLDQPEQQADGARDEAEHERDDERAEDAAVDGRRTGTNGSSSRNTTAWNSSVRMTRATMERLATSARITGRTSRLSAEMNSTAMGRRRAR